MNWLALVFSEHVGGMMIVGAAIAFYVASRAAGDALSPPADGMQSPVRHALAQWGAIVLVCVVAVAFDHTEIAVGVIFSTSVAALSLHLGVAITSTPQTPARPTALASHVGPAAGEQSNNPAASDIAADEDHGILGVRGSRAWAMVLPTAVLALMAGFSGKLTLVHAILFAIQGLLVTMVWDGGRVRNGSASQVRPLSAQRRAQLTLALALALVGAACAVFGAARMSEETGIMSTGLIASAALGPLLVLPMIGSSSLLATQGHAQTAIAASIVIVLLNLCLLLPLVVAGWHARERYVAMTAQPLIAPAAATKPSVTAEDTSSSDPLPVDDMPRVLSFPIAVWRIDTVLLILLGLLLLPVSLNLWEMRRLDGLLLIIIYGCYLVATTILGRRW